MEEYDSEDEEVDREFFEGSALQKFCDKFINRTYYGYCFISHHGSGFDHLILLHHLVRSRIDVKPVFEGHQDSRTVPDICLLLSVY